MFKFSKYQAAPFLLATLFALPTTSWTHAETQVGLWGRGGGSRFECYRPNSRLVEIRVRSGRVIDGIQFVYRDPNGSLYYTPWAGGSGGTMRTFTLGPNEHLVEIRGRAGKYVDRLQFFTSAGRSIAFGRTGGSPFFVKTATSDRIIGIWGTAGSRLTSIGIVTD